MLGVCNAPVPLVSVVQALMGPVTFVQASKSQEQSLHRLLQVSSYRVEYGVNTARTHSTWGSACQSTGRRGWTEWRPSHRCPTPANTRKLTRPSR
ncbi:hypothetical protein PsorP6_007112 [Peronosclerospora sorghi]|uniref:Uncharacterized protein n=1 Tax=Peronosclerospora sorghi TaxID=230839 RepID=A0ACC0W8B1_9STRA|nr:hypothetical protein PsorP6_007112 [Peronosclerospora sorghi]